MADGVLPPATLVKDAQRRAHRASAAASDRASAARDHDLVSEHGHWRQLLLGIPTQPPGLPEDFTEALVRWVFSR